MKINNLFENIPGNRTLLGIFLILALVATLFPPFEWNYEYTEVDRPNQYYRGSTEPLAYTVKSTPIKSYDFLFGYNQKQLYSDVTKRNESFTRSLILSELLVEYLLIGLITALSHLVLLKGAKKNLRNDFSGNRYGSTDIKKSV